MKTAREEPMQHVLALITLSLCLTKKLVRRSVLQCSIGVDLKEKMIDVFHSGGSAMAKKTAKMVTTKEISALKESAPQDNSNAKIKTVLLQLIFATVETIVGIDRMSYIAIMNVQTINSNVIVMVDAYWVHTNVMEIKIVLMDLMKPTKFAITENVTKKRNFHVQMESAFQYYGNVTLTMIAAMIVMNLHIYAGITTVRLVGVVVLVMLTIDAFLSGYSVMERMIAGMAPMSLLKIAHHVKKREISNAKTEDVFQSKY
jgi:hypothetical protein